MLLPLSALSPLRKASNAPAPRAAVATFMPLSPFQAPDELRAADEPAWKAAVAAFCHLGLSPANPFVFAAVVVLDRETPGRLESSILVAGGGEGARYVSERRGRLEYRGGDGE